MIILKKNSHAYLLGVSGSKTINVSALTNEQTHIIQQLVSEFTKANKN